jgi:hypothetical protein
VKGDERFLARARSRVAISVPECARDQSRQAFSAVEVRSRTYAAFLTAFSLGRMAAITDNAHL